MSGVFNAVKKIAGIALPAALTVATGGAAAPVTFGSIAGSVARSLAVNAITGAISGGNNKQSAPQTQAAATTTSQAADTTDAAAKAEEDAKKKRLALNAQGASGNATSPLGVTGSANVTRRNLLGL